MHLEGMAFNLTMADRAPVVVRVQLPTVHRIQLLAQVWRMAYVALRRLCTWLGVDFQKPETECGPEE